MFAQAPPVLQWQKNYGGSLGDVAYDFKILADGSLIMFGLSDSNNGDIAGNHGPANTTDIFLIKSDPSGNILWSRSYGGSRDEAGYSIIATTDGGFIFVGTSNSNDGDVTGHHGLIFFTDVWVVKLDASGNITWQKSYGGSLDDYGGDILETSSGFIISADTNSSDGDVSGNHGGRDLWVLNIDNSGNIIWQNCYGGTRSEGSAGITPTLDGAFLLNTTTNSTDGDVSNLPVSYDTWILKISTSGAIIWDKCIGGNKSDHISKVLVNNNGTYFLAGTSFSNNLPGSFPNSNLYEMDGWVILLDAGGNTVWQKAFGGTKEDVIYDAIKTADGGYLLVGETISNNGIVCLKHLPLEMWMVKMDNSGNIQWNRTYGGSKLDQGIKLALNAAGECIVASQALSSDGDATNNYGSTDIWLTRFSFTGVLISPSVTISADMDSIRCAGSSLQFTAVPVNGGSSPTYQWKVNGVNTGISENPITIGNLFENDIVSCVLTSNANCLDVRDDVTSNSITIKVKLPPTTGFLPKDTALCSYQRIVLGPNTTRFNSFLWSDGSTTMTIKVKAPGIYWLQVRDYLQCLSRDSVTIFPKTCIEGVFIPNAFTPNSDGKNDKFMPIMNADVTAYRFMVYDRWGRIVFETSTLNEGWDGRFKGQLCDPGVFPWQCQFQLFGEEPTLKRGTVLLLK